MSINFAAANMAGYNNPQIEVFEAVLAETGASLAQYPDKSIILNCLSRGSIPVIILRFDTAGYLMLLNDYDAGEIGTSINFSTISGISSSTKIEITYPDSGGVPAVAIE